MLFLMSVFEKSVLSISCSESDSWCEPRGCDRKPPSCGRKKSRKGVPSCFDDVESCKEVIIFRFKELQCDIQKLTCCASQRSDRVIECQTRELLEALRIAVEAIDAGAATAIASTLGNLQTTLTGIINAFVAEVLSGATTIVTTNLAGLLAAVEGLVNSIISGVTSYLNSIITGPVANIVTVVLDLVNGLLPTVLGLLNDITRALGPLFSTTETTIISSLTTLINSLIPGVLAQIANAIVATEQQLFAQIAGLVGAQEKILKDLILRNGEILIRELRRIFFILGEEIYIAVRRSSEVEKFRS